MNFIRRLLLLSVFCSTYGFADPLPPLTVGVESFTPPFVIQTSKSEIYGFDVDLMNSLCAIIQRTCVYKIMTFGNLLTAVSTKEIDLAISSITITPNRAKLVNFTMPYLLSYSRFLTKADTPTTPFSLSLFNGKKIGIETGTVFKEQIQTMDIQDPQLIEYASVNDQLVALRQGDVDMILLDNPIAIYWNSNSSGAFKLMGPPYLYGYGVGIAVSPEDGDLVNVLNQALVQYQKSPEFQALYNRYLIEF